MDRNEFLQIVGYKLVGFEQLHDYWQLKFENGTLSVFTQLSFDGLSNATNTSEVLYTLCELTVVDSYYDSAALLIDFGGIYVIASLKEQDYTGPEAICWHGSEHEVVVFN